MNEGKIDEIVSLSHGNGKVKNNENMLDRIHIKWTKTCDNHSDMLKCGERGYA